MGSAERRKANLILFYVATAAIVLLAIGSMVFGAYVAWQTSIDSANTALIAERSVGNRRLICKVLRNVNPQEHDEGCAELRYLQLPQGSKGAKHEK